jgi:glyoxylase-like metal-dependent hydrolase (beta-lactamase superfamily II)
MQQQDQHRARPRSGFFRSSWIAVTMVVLVGLVGIGGGLAAAAQRCATSHACWDPPYPNMPEIAPPMVHTSKYLPVPASERGPAIDAAKGYRVQSLGSGAYMVTEGVYQMMFIVHTDGVLLVDAPPSIGSKITQAVEDVAPGKKITHLLYSHAHIDHIGFAGEIQKTNPAMKIIAHEETQKLLTRAKDPRRPVPTETFAGIGQKFELNVGGQSLRLEYPGPNHEPGNIEIFHAASKTLMLVDVVFPGWMMWRRLALAQDIPGYFEVVRNLNGKYDFSVLVSGHLNRAGTKADVTTQLEFMSDLHAAANEGIASTKPGEAMNPGDLTNPWAVFDNYIDRVTISCVNKLTPKWKNRLAGYDVYVYDQCMSMEQSLRVDGPSM